MIAILDFGTNTFNLLIAERKDRSFNIIFTSKEPADGVDACKLAWTATGEETTDKQPQGTPVKK